MRPLPRLGSDCLIERDRVDPGFSHGMKMQLIRDKLSKLTAAVFGQLAPGAILAVPAPIGALRHGLHYSLQREVSSHRLRLLDQVC